MSGLANYINGTREISEELFTLLENAEIKELHGTLSGWSSRDWMKWRIQNHDLVCSFVAATPSQRKKLKKFQQQRLMLTLAGFHHCREASTLINSITSPSLCAGLSYREMAALAGDAFNRLFDDDIPIWPYQQMPSPFADSA